MCARVQVEREISSLSVQRGQFWAWRVSLFYTGDEAG